ncbi:MAG TPA: hypothetical protein VFY54_08145, partial [Rubrobacter sp.]|nr:hypothetical protein [Rubrobacter sp.]
QNHSLDQRRVLTVEARSRPIKPSFGVRSTLFRTTLTRTRHRDARSPHVLPAENRCYDVTRPQGGY